MGPLKVNFVGKAYNKHATNARKVGAEVENLRSR
jgi:hypothetical protein